MTVSRFNSTPVTQSDSRFTSHTSKTHPAQRLYPTPTRTSNLRLSHFKSPLKPDSAMNLKCLTDNCFEWLKSHRGFNGIQRLQYALKNNPESIEFLPDNIRPIAMQGREFLLSQSWDRPQNTDDGVKTLMVLAFSRALQANNVQWPLARLAIGQMEQILKFPKMTQHLNTIDNLGKRLFEIFSTRSGENPTRATEQASSVASSKPLKVEFIEDDESSIRILHSIPVKPAGYYSRLDFEA